MKKIIPVLLVIGLALSCEKKPGEKPVDSFDTFDRKAMLRNMGENVIIPSLDSAAVLSQKLLEKVNAFAAAPSQGTLDEAQAAWIASAKGWARVEMYRFGPMNENGINTVAPVHYGTAYPMSYGSAADKAGIDAAIAGSDNLDAAWISNQQGNKRGLPAIEHLLFNKAEGDSKILSDFASARRMAYLQTAADDLHQNLSGISKAWHPSEGNYLATFINADGRDLGSSIGMLLNEIAFMAEMQKNEKVGRPLGKRTSGNPQPNLVEARESKQSLTLLRENITGLKNLFEGRSSTNDMSGFDDLLDHLDAKFGDQPLAALIEQQCDVVNAKIDAINIPLDEAVTNSTADVETLYNEIKKLLVLMKVDAANNIGVQITYFDNDGD